MKDLHDSPYWCSFALFFFARLNIRLNHPSIFKCGNTKDGIAGSLPFVRMVGHSVRLLELPLTVLLKPLVGLQFEPDFLRRKLDIFLYMLFSGATNSLSETALDVDWVSSWSSSHVFFLLGRACRIHGEIHFFIRLGNPVDLLEM